VKTVPLTLTEPTWSKFEAQLRSYVGRRVDARWADDVVGDVLLRLVQHRSSFESAENPVAWMLRVAANAIADHYRRRSAEDRTRALVKTEAQDASARAIQETQSTVDEFARCLVPFIRTLPKPYSDALMLTAIEGLSQAEAARRLGLSHSGVKSRVQRARAQLKQALLRCCALEVDRRGSLLDYERLTKGCGTAC